MRPDELFNLIEFYGKIVEAQDILAEINHWCPNDNLPVDLQSWSMLWAAGECVDSLEASIKRLLEEHFGIEDD